MNNVPMRGNLTVEEVKTAVLKDADALIAAEEMRYHKEIEAVADTIHSGRTNRHIVLLCGPSSSGKTTTASLLKEYLQKSGTAAHVVSLDDFYLGEGKAPVLPDGKPDYECVDALDVDRLTTCLTELVKVGKTELPIFDFKLRRPLNTTKSLILEDDAAVILEGIHAFNPRIGAYLPEENTNRLFINTLTRFVDGEEVWLSRRHIRLCRRILRDDQFRASPFTHTMEMWPQVMRGEDVYMFPYADTADLVVDTTFAFEPCILKGMLLPRLAVSETDHAVETARILTERLSVFPEIPLSALPQGSMLREFTG